MGKAGAGKQASAEDEERAIESAIVWGSFAFIL
jgi:hypothetical protein